MASPELDAPGAPPVFKCGCPCGDPDELASGSGGKFELVPYRFMGQIMASPASAYPHYDPQRLTSRHGDPPDPPPKLTVAA
jgi:hypothetical protein